MTAAFAHLMRPSLRRSSSGWPARLLMVLALALPIPLCAALGLSLPLPATVARIAAKLVPFANSAVLDAREEQLLGARGSIVRFPGEPAGNAGSGLDPGGSPSVLGPRNARGGSVTSGKVDGSTTGSPNGPATTPGATEHGLSAPRPIDRNAAPTLAGGSTSTPGGSTSTPGGGSTPPQGGSDPVPPSVPPTVVDTSAAAPVIGTVSTTATTAASTVAATVAPAVDVVNGVVGPVLPPKP
jgi:hypothetical protein